MDPNQTQENFTEAAAQDTDPKDTAKKPLADNEVRLSDGRIVVMRETNGADEAAVAQMLGDKISLAGAGAKILVQANALKAIVSIDGQTPEIMQSYNKFLSVSREFKTKDLNKIIVKYSEMNLEADDNDPLA